MGVSIEEHRCRIGRYHLRSASVAGPRCRPKLSIAMMLIPVAALCLLLLASGIASNPGPEFDCKVCHKSFVAVSKYWDHVGVHTSDRSTFHCPINECSLRYTTLRSVQSHVSRDHKKITRDVEVQPVQFTCPILTCKCSILSRKQYLQHMAVHLKDGRTFTCCYPCCAMEMSSLRSFRVHVSRCHPKKTEVHAEYDEKSSSTDISMDSGHTLDSANKGAQTASVVKEAETSVNADDDDDDPFPEHAAKDELAKFYLLLEAVLFLPTTAVQVIAQEIKLVTEMSHHFLKKSLLAQLKNSGLDSCVVDRIVETTFNSDPVYNVHHKKSDIEQLGTDYLRQKFWRKHYPYVEPRQVFLGRDENGRKRYAHYVPIRESIKVLLRDPKVKQMVLDSFKKRQSGDQVIYADFTDGSAYAKHMEQHNGGNCIQVNLSSDAFDFHAFGPSQGVYKPVGFYFNLGNFKPEHRSKVDSIQMVYMILEKDMKPTEQEELDDVNKQKEVLRPLLEELEDLKVNGIEIDGEVYPVCLLFSQGDNLGQHILGSFVGSFSCDFSCRMCPLSSKDFRDKPYSEIPFRTPEQYDSAVQKAKAKWISLRCSSLQTAERAKARRLANQQADRCMERIRAPGSKSAIKRILSKSALEKLRAVHHKGVKYRPSPLNSLKLKFHVASPAMPPCLAHDLFEGIVKTMLPKILKYFIDEKKWFDLVTLNRRIKSFPYDASDKADAPTPLKSLKSLAGNAAENWNLLRLLPFLIGDLIQDSQDRMWQLCLSLKVIVEYVCAPKIALRQVLYLRRIIQEYLIEVKALLPEWLTPKHHLLLHYPTLITIFGPLIRVFTLRFESKHVFFKNAGRACRNFINITYTLARKYACRFAYDHSSGSIISEDVLFEDKHSYPVLQYRISEDRQAALPKDFVYKNFRSLSCVNVKSVEYRPGYYQVLDSLDDCDLRVGRIEMILFDTTSKKVFFLLDEKTAANSFQGYFKIHIPGNTFTFKPIDDLQDYYPLPSYNFDSTECLSLKHTITSM